MSSIQILPEDLINKIAAGEVVERPASVVKELVENAIDAGADEVFVTVNDGGKTLISVLDNGKGMNAEDARLAVQRHATSKIKSEEDLDHIVNLGFRGEALAAISSVSRFELTTCQDEEVGGFQYQITGGKRPKEVGIGFPRGTKIVVADLFFNQPARLKFLKAVKTEYHHIYDLVIRQALAHPEIQFKLTVDKKLTLNLPKGQDFLARIEECYGSEIANDLVYIEHEEGYLQFEGYFSHPAQSRSSRRWQQIFLNDRSVKNQTLSQAVYEGYKTLLMKNMHPMFFLKISMSPTEVDVNVHPAKTEVRLRNPTLIHTIFAEGLQRSLKEESRKRFFGDVVHDPAEEPSPVVREGLLRPSGTLTPKSTFVEVNDQIGFRTEHPKTQRSFDTRPEAPAPNAPPRSPQTHTPGDTAFSFNIGQPVKATESTHLSSSPAEFSAIGQLAEKYILAEGPGRLVLVDQHSAHERIRFEEIRTDFYNNQLGTHSLMIPVILALPPQDGLLLEQHQDDFGKLGFQIEPFGGNDYAVKEVPSILKDKDIAQVIRDVLDEMSQFGRTGKMEIFFNEVFEKMACHSAIRAGQTLSLPEMQSLLNQLSQLDLQIHCPHGRPVLVDISLSELDKRFKRIV